MAEEIQFEKALERLEKIVEELESGEISLEDSLKKYEEGVKLSRACQKRLAEAEKRIEVLTRDASGTLVKKAFELEEETEAGAVQKKSATRKARLSPEQEPDENDGDLLL